MKADTLQMDDTQIPPAPGIPDFGDVLYGENDSYEIISLICGYYVYKVKSKKSKKLFAVKCFELEDIEKWERELNVYEKLSSINSPHFPQLIDCGAFGKIKFIVITLLDSLYVKIPVLGGVYFPIEFSNGTKVIMCKQMLQCLKDLHSCDYVHGDLKWDNFGLSGHTICLFDFERSNDIDQDKTTKTAPKDLEHCGNFLFASLADHFSQRLHFKDDIESLCYMMATFFIKLSWIKYDSVSIDDVPLEIVKREALKPGSEFMKDLPIGLQKIIRDCRCLKYNDIPNYDMYQRYLNELFAPEEILPILDWNKTMVFHGSCMPPHKFVPYFDLSTQGKHMELIYNCERWKKISHSSFTKTTTYDQRPSNCSCTITVDGIITVATHPAFTIANVVQENFKCEYHIERNRSVHTCLNDVTHDFFDNPGTERKEAKTKSKLIP